MDEKQLDRKDKAFLTWDLDNPKDERMKAVKRLNEAMLDVKKVTNNPIILNGTPDKTTGLYHDGCSLAAKRGPEDNWVEKQEMPDLRDIRRKMAEIEEKDCCGSMNFLKETKEIPDITTLQEKAEKSDFSKILALAGVAKKQHETTFKKMEDQINYMKNYANSMLRHCDEMQKQVDFLKQLVVLDYSE